MKKLIILFVFLSLCFASLGPAEEEKQGRITGKIMIKDGGLMSNGVVLIYDEKGPIPLPDKYFRVPDIVVFIDDEGKFSADLPPGTYYVGGMRKKTGEGPGPPKEGDYFFISREAAGMPQEYVINENEMLDIGIISEAVPYKWITDREGVTAIEGTILNGLGRPVEGVVVFAETTSASDGKISFVSNWTGKDGKYFLRVHEGGTYVLSAADFLEPRGMYSLENDDSVTLKTGEILRRMDMNVMKKGEE